MIFREHVVVVSIFVCVGVGYTAVPCRSAPERARTHARTQAPTLKRARTRGHPRSDTHPRANPRTRVRGPATVFMETSTNALQANNTVCWLDTVSKGHLR